MSMFLKIWRVLLLTRTNDDNDAVLHDEDEGVENVEY